jgi:hypothetical protein
MLADRAGSPFPMGSRRAFRHAPAKRRPFQIRIVRPLANLQSYGIEARQGDDEMQPSAEGLDDAGNRRDHHVRLALDLGNVGLARLKRIGEAALRDAEHLPQACEGSALRCHPLDLAFDLGALLGGELLHDLVESHRHR